MFNFDATNRSRERDGSTVFQFGGALVGASPKLDLVGMSLATPEGAPRCAPGNRGASSPDWLGSQGAGLGESGRRWPTRAETAERLRETSLLRTGVLQFGWVAAITLTVLCFGLFTPTVRSQTTPAPRNLFAELLGKTDAEVAAKIEAGWQQLFHGDDENERIYFPVGDDMAYIADIASNDVRSEGISYGMMIAVQMDRREEFDRIYRWAKTHMYHADGPRRGYFAWQCAFDGRQIDPGSASDGEEWIATALMFAAHRWGNEQNPDTGALGKSIIDYAAEAQALLRDMLHKPTRDGITAIFDRAEKQVVFAPTIDAARFTDPSYHVPAFYELWARWAEAAEDRAFWAEAAQTSRAFFRRTAHPHTGLMPEYAHFDGRPYPSADGRRGDFRFDAWRTLANVAFDHASFAADPWQVEQSNRVLRFLQSLTPRIPTELTLDGEPLSNDHSAPGLIGMAAVAGLAADPELARPFVQQLWDAPVPHGKYRYYDGLLYQLALLQVGGNFQLFQAAAP